LSLATPSPQPIAAAPIIPHTMVNTKRRIKESSFCEQVVWTVKHEQRAPINVNHFLLLGFDFLQALEQLHERRAVGFNGLGGPDQAHEQLPGRRWNDSCEK